MDHGADTAVRFVGKTDVLRCEHLGCPPAEVNVQCIFCRRVGKPFFSLFFGEAPAVKSIDGGPGHKMSLAVFVTGIVNAAQDHYDQKEGNPVSDCLAAGFLLFLFFFVLVSTGHRFSSRYGRSKGCSTGSSAGGTGSCPGSSAGGAGSCPGSSAGDAGRDDSGSGIGCALRPV